MKKKRRKKRKKRERYCWRLFALTLALVLVLALALVLDPTAPLTPYANTVHTLHSRPTPLEHVDVKPRRTDGEPPLALLNHYHYCHCYCCYLVVKRRTMSSLQHQWWCFPCHCQSYYWQWRSCLHNKNKPSEEQLPEEETVLMVVTGVMR